MTQHVSEVERWAQLVALDDELLKGGVILPEWCSLIVREADVAFAKGAFLASILTAVAGIEAYLRSESALKRNTRFVELIDAADIDNELRRDLHDLRRYRNAWVHLDDPWDDRPLLEDPDTIETELHRVASVAARCLRRTIFSVQWT